MVNCHDKGICVFSATQKPVVARGEKTFELRKDDRKPKFAVNDVLELQEFEQCGLCEGVGHFVERRAPKSKRTICVACDGAKGTFTEDTIERVVTYVMRGPQFGLEAGWVCMGLKS